MLILCNRHGLTFLILIGILLSGCNKIQATALKLGPLLIQPGDIAADVEASDVLISTESQPFFRDLPPRRETRYQRYRRNGQLSGWVAALLYPSTSDQASAYGMLVARLGPNGQALPNLGDQATGLVSSASAGDDITILFTRCEAIIAMHLGPPITLDSAMGYAQQLDQRLTPLLCR